MSYHDIDELLERTKEPRYESSDTRDIKSDWMGRFWTQPNRLAVVVSLPLSTI